jgi:alpha-glucosidase (family GH31 glycosyl hydrolase)
MYYAYPKRNAAYEVKNQFMFGSELMVAPITKPCSKQSGLGSTEVWFPKGDWFDFFSGLHYTSNNGRKLHVCRSLHEYPVFAKAGAIVPMQTSKELVAGNELEIVVFPGASNNFTLYEDGGDGSEFEKFKSEFKSNRVKFKGSVSDISSYYKRAKIIVSS